MRIKKNIAVSESGFLFDPNTGDSFSLNETGKFILSELQKGKLEEEIKVEFLSKYEVEESAFENDFNDFRNLLENHNLAE